MFPQRGCGPEGIPMMGFIINCDLHKQTPLSLEKPGSDRHCMLDSSLLLARENPLFVWKGKGGLTSWFCGGCGVFGDSSSCSLCGPCWPPTHWLSPHRWSSAADRQLFLICEPKERKAPFRVETFTVYTSIRDWGGGAWLELTWSVLFSLHFILPAVFQGNWKRSNHHVN